MPRRKISPSPSRTGSRTGTSSGSRTPIHFDDSSDSRSVSPEGRLTPKPVKCSSKKIAVMTLKVVAAISSIGDKKGATAKDIRRYITTKAPTTAVAALNDEINRTLAEGLSTGIFVRPRFYGLGNKKRFLIAKNFLDTKSFPYRKSRRVGKGKSSSKKPEKKKRTKAVKEKKCSKQDNKSRKKAPKGQQRSRKKVTKKATTGKRRKK